MVGSNSRRSSSENISASSELVPHVEPPNCLLLPARLPARLPLSVSRERREDGRPAAEDCVSSDAAVRASRRA